MCEVGQGVQGNDALTKPLPVHAFRVHPVKFRGQVTVFFFSFVIKTKSYKEKVMALVRIQCEKCLFPGHHTEKGVGGSETLLEAPLKVFTAP